MTSATDRRAVLGAVLAAGTVGATAVLPAAASAATTLSAVDRRVLDLWRQHAELKAIYDHNINSRMAREYSADWANLCNALNDIKAKLAKHFGTSVLALGAILTLWIDDELYKGLNRASLRAIRPQLVGAIAEAADQVLAEDEEARA